VDGSYTEVRLDGKIAHLTLTREKALNAVNVEFADELLRVATYLAGHRGLRLVVIRGRGRALSTGIDLRQLANGELPFGYFETWERALRTFEVMDKIVVTVLHGYALGGGLQLALATDVRISTASCVLGLPAVKESLIPGLGAWRLVRSVGYGRARELILSGRDLDAREAKAIGLVDHVVEAVDPVDPAVDRLVTGLLATCSEGTIASKQLITELDGDRYQAALRAYLRRQFQCFHGPDAMEARRAYLAKEAPRWL
jgi:enoyl-CoA hydratase/carnithine racemase